MGILLFICFREETSTMKSVIVVCLAALAAAEPEADAYYGSYGYGLGYSNLGYGYAPMRYSGAYGYAAPATSAGIAVRGYGTPATVGTNVPYGYAASGNYVADSFGAVHIAKREADAEPEADALYGYGYNNIGYSNLGYSNIGYSNLGVSTYTRPVATVSRIATPVVSRPVVSTVSRIAAPVVSSFSAPIVSRPALISRTSGIWKREAEAEPEADAYYGSYGYNNIGYSNLGVSTYTRPVVSRIATPVVSTVSRIAAPVVSRYAAPVVSRPIVSGYSSL